MKLPPQTMDHDELAEWTERLTGVELARAAYAHKRLANIGVPHVERELSRPQLDDAVAKTLLAEAIDQLAESGVPEAKLVAKLRADKEVWPTWAELTAAAAILRVGEPGTKLQLEARRSSGSHADFTLQWEGREEVHIEFKAIGLSDEEATFSAAAIPALRSVVPRHGVAHLHSSITQKHFRLNRAERRHIIRESESRSKNLPKHAQEIAAAVAVAHGTEAMYLARLRERFSDALRQLPRDRPSWVAFTWGNGAPLSSIAQALDTIAIPDNVRGVMFFGTALVLPDPSLHHFVMLRPGPFHRAATMDMRSLWDDELGEAVLNAIQTHTNVRPMIVAVQTRAGRHELVVRDGARRILPFTFLLAGDPDEYRRVP